MTLRGSHLLRVSVIMPIRNEADFIEHSLAAVLNQDYPSELMEVLVVDGMSDDGTREFVLGLINRQHKTPADGRTNGEPSLLTNHISPVRLIDNPRQIVPTALNSAIRRAKGKVIIIIGGHAMIESDYVRRCVESLSQTSSDCVGGALDSVGVGYVGTAIAAAMSSRFGVGGSGFRITGADAEPRLTDSVPFPAYRQDVFKRIGLYNEVMVRHQDYEFNYRLRKAGGRVLLLPSVRIKYYVRSSLRSLWRQYWQYGMWKGSFLRSHPASLKLRHLIPPLFILLTTLSILLAISPYANTWAMCVAPAAYLAFVLVALAAVTKGGTLRYAPILPFVFACLHFSYGLGIWSGLISPKMSRNKHQEDIDVENRVELQEQEI